MEGEQKGGVLLYIRESFSCNGVVGMEKEGM